MSSKKTRKGTSRYKVKNWSTYEKGLVQRGSLTFWMNKDIASSWYVEEEEPKQRGAQKKYKDLAIETCLTLRLLYGLPLRQTEGFVNSLFELIGSADIKSPDHSTFSRRSKTIKTIKQRLNKGENLYISLDATGLKIFGNGEWCEEKHGKGKRKNWMKLHIGIDEETKEIVAFILTDNKATDGSQAKKLLDQIPSISSVKADGAYDQDDLRKYIKDRKAKSIFPPRKDAVLSKDFQNQPTERDKTILAIEKRGRDVWEYSSGYSKRNLVENAFYRYKQIIGSSLRARDMDAQKTEVAIAVNIINKMTQNSMPESVRAK